MLMVTRFGTRDLAKARVFYDGLAEVLGAARAFDMDNLTAYRGPEGALFVVGIPLAGEATFGNGTQVGFAAPSREAVDAAHAKALAMGGKSEGAPGFRGPEEMGFYAAYFRDLDGNKILVAHGGPK
jgi:catechol 2,3-dioxygenase-like lactoylglutathione lyase family enzyme